MIAPDHYILPPSLTLNTPRYQQLLHVHLQTLITHLLHTDALAYHQSWEVGGGGGGGEGGGG